MLPQPHDPDASMVRWTAGYFDGDGRSETPFHSGRNSCHHARSALKPLFSLIMVVPWWVWCTACSNSNIRRRKERPDWTTLQAWLSEPNSDSRSLRGHTFLSPQSCRNSLRWVNLSAGRRSWPATVFISMTKNTRHEVRPSCLCPASGTPR